MAHRAGVRGNLERAGHKRCRLSCREIQASGRGYRRKSGKAGACLVLDQPTVPPFFSHAAFDLAGSHPWPLQEFWPLHALSALLQALVPLQELIP